MNRILDGSDLDWLHGHENIQNGEQTDGPAVGVAYYNTWKTSEGPTDPDVASTSFDWLVMCGSNAGAMLKLANGVDVGAGSKACNGMSFMYKCDGVATHTLTLATGDDCEDLCTAVDTGSATEEGAPSLPLTLRTLRWLEALFDRDRGLQVAGARDLCMWLRGNLL